MSELRQTQMLVEVLLAGAYVLKAILHLPGRQGWCRERGYCDLHNPAHNYQFQVVHGSLELHVLPLKTLD